MINKIKWPVTFPYYEARIKSKKPKGIIDLNDFIELINNPDEDIINIFDKIATCEANGDIKGKRILKENLYYVTPAVRTNMKGRAYSDIIEFTGIMPLDFDHIENAPEFRDYLMSEYNFIFASWLSASKKGVRCFVSIPTCETVEEYKSLFWGLANEIMMKYKGFDIAPQNAVLPLFISYDPDMIVRDIAELWTKTGSNKKTENIGKAVNLNYQYSYKNENRYYHYSLNNTKKAIDKIVSDGHPQLRAAAFALGGYVGAGYVDKIEAITFINGLIATNGYLIKGVAGYQKTASEMIDKGILHPLYF